MWRFVEIRKAEVWFRRQIGRALQDAFNLNSIAALLRLLAGFVNQVATGCTGLACPNKSSGCAQRQRDVRQGSERVTFCVRYPSLPFSLCL